MILLNGTTPAIAFEDFVPRFMSRSNYYHHRDVSKKITAIGTGGNGREVYIDYLNIQCKKIKATVMAAYGWQSDADMYAWLAREPFRKLIQPCEKAHADLLKYTKPNGQGLEPALILRLTYSSGICNAIDKLLTDKQALKRTLNTTIASFWQTVASSLPDLQSSYPHTLPASPDRLKKMYRRYKCTGVQGLISGKVGNTNPLKIVGEFCQKKLLGLIEHPIQYDDVMVAYLYNQWAKEQGYKDISDATVQLWRTKNKHRITQGREGLAAYNNKYTRQIKGMAPTRPGLLWESDDFHLNYWFNKKGGKAAEQWERYVSYMVADSRHGLLLGACVRQAKAPTFKMVKLAWLDAMYYVRQLTGGTTWYLPHEVKADHWERNKAFPFFRQIGKFNPPAVGNKNGRYIETLFGTKHFERCQKIPAHENLNYNGRNMTAKSPGVNLEIVKSLHKIRPTTGDEAVEQIHQLIHLSRTLPYITGASVKDNPPSLEEKWLADWNQLSDEEKRPISDEQFLLLFGIEHKPNERGNTITNRGIEAQIEGHKYSFDLPDYRNNVQHIGKQITLLYDPYDMSRALAIDDKGLRLIVTAAILSPRAELDSTPEALTRLRWLQQQKRLQVQEQLEDTKSRNDQRGIDIKQMRYAGSMDKDDKYKLEDAAMKLRAFAPMEEVELNYNDLF